MESYCLLAIVIPDPTQFVKASGSQVGPGRNLLANQSGGAGRSGQGRENCEGNLECAGEGWGQVYMG